MRTCEECGASGDTVRLDTYNDFGDNPGNLICDDCLGQRSAGAREDV